jgi:ribosomal protein S18 acetylase RimI-like enzyme
MIKLKKLNDCTFSEVTHAWNEAFSNYPVNIQITEDKLAIMLGRKQLLPSLSIVAFLDNRPVGFVLNAMKELRGIKMAWNGGTGVSPHCRGRGIGKLLMEATIDEYQKESVEIATLEVIESNTNAINLYEQMGYKKTKRLKSYSSTDSLDISSLQIVDNREYRIRHGLGTDIKNIPFYNHEVAWESMYENIFNGESFTILDKKGEVVGYALFKRLINQNEEVEIVLYQCEIKQEAEDIEGICKSLLFSVFATAPYVRTGDFISSSKTVTRLFEKIGLIVTAERYLMNKLL